MELKRNRYINNSAEVCTCLESILNTYFNSRKCKRIFSKRSGELTKVGQIAFDRFVHTMVNMSRISHTLCGFGMMLSSYNTNKPKEVALIKSYRGLIHSLYNIGFSRNNSFTYILDRVDDMCDGHLFY